MVSRRKFLKALSAAGVTVSLAGCSDNTNSNDGSGQELDPPSLGDPDKPRIAVFEDYACPHCRSFDLNVFPRIKEDFIDTNKIEYVHRDFVLPVTDYSAPAAMGGRAVQDIEGNDAFWDYKKIVLENQASLDYDLIKLAAEEAGADPDEVFNRVQDGEYKSVIDNDKNYGSELGVDSTPTVVYIETGEELSLQSYSEFSDLLESKLH